MSLVHGMRSLPPGEILASLAAAPGKDQLRDFDAWQIPSRVSATFERTDLLAYTVGIAIVLLVEKLLLEKPL